MEIVHWRTCFYEGITRLQKLNKIFNSPLISPVRETVGQFAGLCEEIGKAVTLQKVFNPELFPQNGSLRGLKRLTTEARSEMLAGKMIRCWYDQNPNPREVDMLLKA